MQTRVTMVLLICLLFALVPGCSKPEDPPPTPEPQAATRGLPVQAASAVDAPGITSGVGMAQSPIQAEAAREEAQGLIEKARGFLSQKRHQDAITTLHGLQFKKLTPEQQKAADSLKAEIQADLARAAAAATRSNAAAPQNGTADGDK